MKRLSIVLLLCALLALPSGVRADGAPPPKPPGSNLQPGTDVTEVRMVAETVLIEVKNETTSDSPGSAAITADFTMRNLGIQDESMAVRFPISAYLGESPTWPELTGFAVKVNGKPISSRRADYPELRHPDLKVPWAEFDVDFPVNKDVQLQIRYNLEGSGTPKYAAYYYVLETGAGWKDTIGSADIILRLPYPASTQNVVMYEPSAWGALTTPGGVFTGPDVRWHYEDFEPASDGAVHDMQFVVVTPSAWQVIMKARSAVALAPNDGEAWGRLGMTYKDVFFSGPIGGRGVDPGGEELFALAVEAYEHCLKLLPYDAEWHAGLAELLAYRQHFFWKEIRPEMYRALEEMRTALQLAPDDEKVKDVAGSISEWLPDAMRPSGTGYDFAWLTETPTAVPPIPGSATLALVATPTVLPPATAVPQTAIPSSKPASLPCGSAALVPLAIGFWAARKRLWALSGTTNSRNDEKTAGEPGAIAKKNRV